MSRSVQAMIGPGTQINRTLTMTSPLPSKFMTTKHRILTAYSGTTYRDALLSMRGHELTIVSAFGRSTDEIGLLRTLAEQNRRLTFIVGTQNCFTSPEFIKAGAKLAAELKNFEFVVDFRGARQPSPQADVDLARHRDPGKLQLHEERSRRTDGPYGDVRGREHVCVRDI